MKKHIKPLNEISGAVIEQLQRGAFLTVKSGDKINVMTIGWGQTGIMWGLPVFVTPVRYSRYTYKLLLEADDFTISVPERSQMTKELAFCGSKSGRDTDKISVLGLRMSSGGKTLSPVVADCRYHFECRKVAAMPLSDESFPPGYKERFYKAGDYHVLFFGEILESYITE